MSGALLLCVSALSVAASGSSDFSLDPSTLASNPAQAEVDCRQTYFPEDSGTVESPIINFNFTGYVTCYYMIRTDPGKVITLTFELLNTVSSTDCEDNYLKVIDLEASTDLSPPEIPCFDGRMCGPSIWSPDPITVVSHGNVVMIEFRRNDQPDQAFEIDYEVEWAPEPITGSYLDLHKALHANFSTALPINEHNEPVEVDLKLTLKHILEVNTQYERVTLIIWKEESWIDEKLSWSLDDFNIQSVGIRAIDLWFPDIIPYNLLSKNEYLTPQTVTILHTGKVVSVQALKLGVDCETDGYDTYSGSICRLKMGSWTYNAHLLKFGNVTADSLNIAEFSPTSKYEIMSNQAEKEIHITPGLPEHFNAIMFRFCFRLKGAYLEP